MTKHSQGKKKHEICRFRNLLLNAILRDVLANRCYKPLEIDSHRRLPRLSASFLPPYPTPMPFASKSRKSCLLGVFFLKNLLMATVDYFAHRAIE